MDSIFSTDAFLLWHELARLLAFALLAGLLGYALVQYLGSRTRKTSARWFHTESLRTSLVIDPVLVGVVPALALNLFLTERSAHLRQERMTHRVEENAVAMAYAVNRYVDKHVAGIFSAASTITSAEMFDADALTQSLLLYHNVYEDFLTMLSADRNGLIVAASMVPGRDSEPGELVKAADDALYYAKAAGRNCVVFSKDGWRHDQILKHSFVNAGIGADYVISERYSISATYYKSISSDNVYELDGAFTMGFTRNF